MLVGSRTAMMPEHNLKLLHVTKDLRLYLPQGNNFSQL